ncbi:hypothetical protein DPEC_G00305610 [Dallia pectoralis]|uniref:Uncharacterized protein n=1 Tax=Dallia pectoralis TaxID=75939 RepID=A0ACC2FDU5_DALPE|nr:hypothetical protein DPEC_G00305610 [Dallia pectoralis]
MSQSSSKQTAVPGSVEEKESLQAKPKSPPSLPDYRTLAICSIICGLSCIGIFSLINSAKVKHARTLLDPEKAQTYSKKAKKFGIISIVVWVTILILTPILLVFLSYIVTLID